MRRCPHSVYDPTGTGVSPYCSGCTVPDVSSVPAPRTEFTPFPGGEKKCPRCGERKGFRYVDEWDYHCKACDLDALSTDD